MTAEASPMRYLILADVHANLDALNAVLEEAKKMRYERVLCLGDVVGYGAQPNECIEKMRSLDAICIMGNHDAAVCGKLTTEWFNPEAVKCIKWTKQKITSQNKKWLSTLPYFFSTRFLLAVHGSPMNPLTDYMDKNLAIASLEKVVEDLIVVGHTHESFYYTKGAKGIKRIPENEKLKLMGKRAVVNVPAAGQPRDGNPKAGFAVLDFEARVLNVKRVEYNVKGAAEKIRAAGLPASEAERLFKGY